MTIRPELMDAADLQVNGSKPTEPEMAEISAAIRARKQTGEKVTSLTKHSKSATRQ